MKSNRKIESTNFSLPGQVGFYKGKVRDVYDLDDSLMMVVTDRYSAFDRNLAVIPNKGALLAGLSRWWFENTKDIIPNHIISYPDPNVMWCRKYKVVPIEMVVRGYITGVTNTSLWNTYSEGQRDYGPFTLPEGLKKNDQLSKPVLTPTTKFEKHDRNLTPDQAVKEGLLSQDLWEQMRDIALKLFTFGQKTADAKGLLLVDTKYEFGTDENDQLILIDEIHSQDSSRYWLKETYEKRLAAGQEPDNYDKEFLRIWFKNNFDPYAEGSQAPEVPPEIFDELIRRYTYVYEKITGQNFTSDEVENPAGRIENNILKALKEK